MTASYRNSEIPEQSSGIVVVAQPEQEVSQPASASELVQIQNNNVVVSSRQIAEHFEKEHKNVVRDIEVLKKDLLKIELIFFETDYTDTYGRTQKQYLMTRDGFTFLAMRFTGSKALQWQIKYIAAFNKMEKQLKEQAQQPTFEIPQTFAAALQLAANQAQQIEDLFWGRMSRNMCLILLVKFSQLKSQPPNFKQSSGRGGRSRCSIPGRCIWCSHISCRPGTFDERC